MTLDEFERGYAERSGMSPENLRALGMGGTPCDCGESICRGWQMVWRPCGFCGHRQSSHIDRGRCLGDHTDCACRAYIPADR